jgi:hypothetical protein
VQAALILEDDVVLPSDLNALVDATAGHLSGADLVLLNFHSDEPCRVTRAGSLPLPASRLLVRVVDETQVTSAGAYLITRQACERMVETALPIRAHPDDWGFYSKAGVIDHVRCIVPMPVRNSTALRTTIDYYSPDSFQARIRETVARRRVPVLYQALALRRRRTFRRWGWAGRTQFVEEGRQG